MGAILWYLVYRQYHFIANVARGGQSPAFGEVILPSDQNIHEPKLLDNFNFRSKITLSRGDLQNRP